MPLRPDRYPLPLPILRRARPSSRPVDSKCRPLRAKRRLNPRRARKWQLQLQCRPSLQLHRKARRALQLRPQPKVPDKAMHRKATRLQAVRFTKSDG